MAINPIDSCAKDSTYNIHSKTYFINHWGFLGCVLIITIIASIFFVSYNNSYRNTQQEILELHKKYCDNFIPQYSSDSIIAYPDFRPVLDAHFEAVSDSLKLQYDKIQNDYAILTIWASVLMIIFLIFSIYSMFKIDEIQKQGRESLKLIDDTYVHVRDKSDNLDCLVADATQKIEKTIDLKISDFTAKLESKNKELEVQIEKYQDAISETASQNQQIYDLFVKAVTNNVSAKDNQPAKRSKKK